MIVVVKKSKKVLNYFSTVLEQKLIYCIGEVLNRLLFVWNLPIHQTAPKLFVARERSW